MKGCNNDRNAQSGVGPRGCSAISAGCMTGKIGTGGEFTSGGKLQRPTNYAMDHAASTLMIFQGSQGVCTVIRIALVIEQVSITAEAVCLSYLIDMERHIILTQICRAIKHSCMSMAASSRPRVGRSSTAVAELGLMRPTLSRNS